MSSDTAELLKRHAEAVRVMLDNEKPNKEKEKDVEVTSEEPKR